MREINLLIIRGDIRDKRVRSGTMVSAVNVTRDLSKATVLVIGPSKPNLLEESIEGLNHAAGFIQGKLGQKMSLRMMPRLHFKVDTAMLEGASVLQALRKG